jgi:hypothetical protein
VASRPSPHHLSCRPLSEAALRQTYAKTPTTTVGVALGKAAAAAAAFAHAGGGHVNEASNGFDENNEEYEDFDNMDSFYQDKDESRTG